MQSRRSFKSILCLALISFGLQQYSKAQQLWSGVLSQSRAADWTKAGAGTIPTNRTQCGSTIAPYGSSSSPGSPSTIANAINACPAGTYLQLGTGTFYLSGSIFISTNNVTLRGMGPQNTILNFSNASPCGEAHPAAICVAGGDDGTDGSDPSNVSNFTTAPSQAATSILLGTQTTGSMKPVVGQILELQQQVDGTSASANTWPLPFSCFLASGGCSVASSGVDDGSPTQWGGLFQLVVVTSITGGTCTNSSPCTVGITPPIHMPNWGQQATRIWWQNESSVTGVGIENLQTTNNPQIGFRWATYSWMKNVVLNGYGNGGAPHYILLNKTVGITTRDSLLWGNGNWSDEYAWDCYACSATLAENNIVGFIRTGFTQEQGEFNVVDYTYDIKNATSSNSGNEEGDFNNHGCCSAYLLGEGNDSVNWINDDYYGQTFFTTLFRNRFYGNTSLDVPGDTGYLTPIVSSSLTRYPNFVGNVLGCSGSGCPGTGSNTYSHYQQVGQDSNNSCSYGNTSIYSIGKFENCGGNGSVPNDNDAAPSSLRWGNWDIVTNAVRWCGSSSDTGWSATCGSTSEVPTGLADYPNSVPTYGDTAAGQSALPASLLYSSQPSWWSVTGQAAIPWPPIGPGVSGGNLSGSAGYANKIPARVCYESLGGSFASTTPPAFDASLCYPSNTSTQAPAAPTGLAAVVQ
jgi:hypothetical protein